MKQKKAIASVAFLLLGLGGLHAQESPTAAGGDATGTGGAASYSVGQVVYATATGTNGSVAQGVQQPYEISITSGIENTDIQLEMVVYPNPTTDYLNLKIESEQLESLIFQLYDVQGKILDNNQLNQNTTTIKMGSYPKGVYFLKVTDNNKLLKTYRIIKN